MIAVFALFLLPVIQDVLFWMRDKTEVEVVDFILRLNDLLVSAAVCVISLLVPQYI